MTMTQIEFGWKCVDCPTKKRGYASEADALTGAAMHSRTRTVRGDRTMGHGCVVGRVMA